MDILRNAFLIAVLLGTHSAYAAEAAKGKFPTGHWVSKLYLKEGSPDVEQFDPFAEVDFAACGTQVCGRIVKEDKCSDVSMILTREASGTWSGTWTSLAQTLVAGEMFMKTYDINIKFSSDKEMLWETKGDGSLVSRSLDYSTELVHKGGNVCAPAV